VCDVLVSWALLSHGYYPAGPTIIITIVASFLTFTESCGEPGGPAGGDGSPYAFPQGRQGILGVVAPLRASFFFVI